MELFKLLFIVFIILNSVISAIKKKSIVMFSILLFLCWLVAVMRVGGPDFSVYEQSYLQDIPFDFGYYFISLLFHDLLHLSFVQFRGVVFFLSILLVGDSIWKYSKHPNWIVVVFAMIQYPVEIIQVRNFIAFSIFIFSFRFLLSGKKKCWISFLLLSCSFHLSFAFYLPFVLILWYYKSDRFQIIARQFFVLFLVFSFFASIVLLLFPSLTQTMLIRFSNILGEKTVYLSPSVRYGFILYIIYQLFLIYILGNIGNEKKSTQNLLSVVLLMNILVFLYIPLFRLNINFLRIFRNLFLISYITISNNSSNKNFSLKRIQNFWYLLLAFYSFSAFAVSYPAIFENTVF